MSQSKASAQRPEIGVRSFATSALLALFALQMGCTDGGGVGADCSSRSDCRNGLQCLAQLCAPLCRSRLDCSDGFLCSAAGNCEEVLSNIGDTCNRELDCGPAQACQINTAATGDLLAGTCTLDQPGGATGAGCAADADCRNGLCTLGRCSELCADDSDCPSTLSCAKIPRLLVGAPTSAVSLFRGCLQSGGTLALEVPVSRARQTVAIAVPSSAESVTVVSQITDETQLIGAASVISPSGALLFEAPTSAEEFYLNPLRHSASHDISTLIIPNTPAIELETGVYQVDVASFFPATPPMDQFAITPGTAIPSVMLLYKMAPTTNFDIHFHFLDLSDHPCRAVGTLSAITAPNDADFLTFQTKLQDIFTAANIGFADITYDDINRPDLDGLRTQDLSRLLRLSTASSGINIFMTRSIVPVGVQALSGGNPGPPSMPGTAASGIAVSMDTLCYRSWSDLARTTAHQVAQLLGLFRNREPDGALDPIPDSDDSSANLMFFSEFGGTVLSPGQASVLQLYPGAP